MDFNEWAGKLEKRGIGSRIKNSITGPIIVLYTKKNLHGNIDFNRLFEIVHQHRGWLNVTQIYHASYQLEVEMKVAEMMAKRNPSVQPENDDNKISDKEKERRRINKQVAVDTMLSGYYESGEAQTAEKGLIELIDALDSVNWCIANKVGDA